MSLIGKMRFQDIDFIRFGLGTDFIGVLVPSVALCELRCGTCKHAPVRLCAGSTAKRRKKNRRTYAVRLMSAL